MISKNIQGVTEMCISTRILVHKIILYIFILFELLVTVELTTNTQAVFKVFADWPDSNVSSLDFYGSAVAICPRSHQVVVLHRCDSWKKPLGRNLISCDTVYILDSVSGKILLTWGKNLFVKPHGIEINERGDLFVTDVVLHQVLKFPYLENPSELPNWSTIPELTLGERLVSGNDESHFCSPADVAVVKDSEEFFVADGYCNSRVVKFSKEGRFLQEFGAGSSIPTLLPLPFNVTHAVAISYPKDNSNSNGSNNGPLLFVADRNNGRIQSFTINGTFLYEISSEVFSPRNAMLFSISIVSSFRRYNLESEKDKNNGSLLYAVTGKLPRGKAKVYEILVGIRSYKVLSEFPISSSEEVVETNGSLETPHDLVVSRDGREIYIVEASGNLTVWKFVKSCGSGVLLVDIGMFGILKLLAVTAIILCSY